MFGFKKRTQKIADAYGEKLDNVLTSVETLGFTLDVGVVLAYSQESFANNYTVPETVGAVSVISMAEHVKYRESHADGWVELLDVSMNLANYIIANKDAGYYREDLMKMDARAAYELGIVKEGSTEANRSALAEQVLRDQVYQALGARFSQLRINDYAA